MKTTSRLTLVLALSLAPTVAPRLVHAEASEVEKANARKLFNEGLDLRQAGDAAGALAKFEAADAILPSPRGRLELGRQRVLMGRLVEGHLTLLSVAGIKVDSKDESKYAPYKAEAAKLATEVEARIPQIKIALVGGPADVTVDGVAVPSAALGEARMVNPGKHVLVAKTPAAEKKEEVTIAEGETKTITLTLPKGADVPAPHSLPTPGGAPPPPKDEAPRESGGLGTQRTISLALGGLGVVGAIVGTWAGLSARSLRDEAAPYCKLPNNGCSDSRGVDLRSRAIGRADLSTIAFVSAGVLLGGAAVLWVTSPSGSTEKSTALVVGPGSLSLVGRF